MSDLGKVLLWFGIVLVVVGGALIAAATLSDKVGWIGRLPGDLHVKRENWSFYFPLTTSLVISVVLTLLFVLLGRR